MCRIQSISVHMDKVYVTSTACTFRSRITWWKKSYHAQHLVIPNTSAYDIFTGDTNSAGITGQKWWPVPNAFRKSQQIADRVVRFGDVGGWVILLPWLWSTLMFSSSDSNIYRPLWYSLNFVDCGVKQHSHILAKRIRLALTQKWKIEIKTPCLRFSAY